MIEWLGRKLADGWLDSPAPTAADREADLRIEAVIAQIDSLDLRLREVEEHGQSMEARLDDLERGNERRGNGPQ